MKEIIEFTAENMHKIKFNMVGNKVYATNIDENNVFVGEFEFLFNKWVFIPVEGLIWDYNIHKIWSLKDDNIPLKIGKNYVEIGNRKYLVYNDSGLSNLVKRDDYEYYILFTATWVKKDIFYSKVDTFIEIKRNIHNDKETVISTYGKYRDIVDLAKEYCIKI